MRKVRRTSDTRAPHHEKLKSCFRESTVSQQKVPLTLWASKVVQKNNQRQNEMVRLHYFLWLIGLSVMRQKETEGADVLASYLTGQTVRCLVVTHVKPCVGTEFHSVTDSERLVFHAKINLVRIIIQSRWPDESSSSFGVDSLKESL